MPPKKEPDQRPTATDGSVETVPPKELVSRKVGVVCILTTEIKGETKLVLTTLPSEDYESQTKEEVFYNYNDVWGKPKSGLMPLVRGMLCFPGGGVVGEESNIEAIIREIHEETGLVVSDDRLESFVSTLVVEQTATGAATPKDRVGKRSFDLRVFLYHLDEKELNSLKDNLAKEGRRVEVMSPDEALKRTNELRPAAVGAIKAYLGDQQCKRLGISDEEAYGHRG